MRIAMVSETFLPSIDGVVTRMLHTLDWFLDQGHDVSVIAPDLGCDAYRAVPVLGIRAIRWPLYRFRQWGTPSPQVMRYLDSLKPDIVHVWQPSIIGPMAVHWCVKNACPLVTSYHTDISSYLGYYGPIMLMGRAIRAYQRYEHNRGFLTMVTSEAMKDKLAKQGVHNLVVLPKGVDLEARSPSFKNEAMRDRLSNHRSDTPLLVYIGRLAPEKNLESLADLARTHPQWSFAFVGDGPRRAHMKAVFPSSNTVFSGFLGGDDLSSAYASADIFVFPSTTETLGLSIIEAQASGVPVICAKSPATCEQITHGKNGLIYDPSDKKSLETCVESVLNDPELRATLIKEGLQTSACYGWDRASCAIMDAYELALEAYAQGWRPT